MTFPNTPLMVAREATQMAKSANEKDAMLLQKVAVGAMFIMALPCALQAVKEVFKMLHGDKEHSRER